MNRHPIIIKGRQSCRRGDGIQSNHTRAGPIIRWAGSRNGHYPALLSSIARISPIFPAIPLVTCSSQASLFTASPPHHLRGKPIDNRYIADFPSHPFRYPAIANQLLSRIPRLSPQRQAHREAHASPPLPSMIGLSIARPIKAGRAFTARSTLAAGRASQAADCAENSPQRPSFGQTGRKAIFPWNGGLTPVRGIINIRSVSTRQAIPP